MNGGGRYLVAVLAVLGMLAAAMMAGAAEPVARFPRPDFASGYAPPHPQCPAPRSAAREWADVAVLAGAMAATAWFALKRRSRWGVAAVGIFSIVHFGFIRKGCVCPVGSIQNVAAALGHSGYAIPWTVVLFFLLPLVFTLFFGRVFCAAVCPLGAIQDVVIRRPVRLSPAVVGALSFLPYMYLGLAVLLAALGAGFVICQFDPFISFYRLGGDVWILFTGAGLLILGIFVARPYCRFLCPYGVLLNWVSRLSVRHVTITPDECVNCRLCEKACPFDSILPSTPERPPEARPVARRHLAWTVALGPMLVAAGVGVGWLLHAPLSTLHPTVRLAERVAREERGVVQGMTLESEAFRGTGTPLGDLYTGAAEVSQKFRLGAGIVGGLLGLALACRLMGLSVWPRRKEYTIDRGDCLSCARCFEYCPVGRKGVAEFPRGTGVSPVAQEAGSVVSGHPERCGDAPFHGKMRSFAIGGAVVAAVFCLAISLLLLANYAQLKAADPLNSPALLQLRHEFSQAQTDAKLKTRIRALDLLARRAFFTKQWQLNTGGLLLLCGAGVCVALARLAGALRAQVPDPKSLKPLEAAWARRPALRRGTWLVGGGVVALAVAAWIGAEQEFAAPEAPSLPALAPAAPKEPIDPGGGAAPDAPQPTGGHKLGVWPNFRGPGGNAIASAKGVPVKWDARSGQGIKWKTALPRAGYGSPVMWGNRVFVTAGDREARELYGIDADSGRLVWTTAVNRVAGAAVAEIPEVNDNTGLAAPSPATDGTRVYAIFGTGELLCTDTDGKVVWNRYLGKPANHYGHASSLLVVDELLIVQWDDAERPRLLALNTATGATVWETARQAISWASPICVDTGKRRELILCDSTGVESFDPRKGVSFWRQDCLGGEVAPSAAYGEGMVFVANAYAKATGLRLSGTGAEVAWQWDEALPDTASPLVVGGRLLLAAEGGPLVCLSAKDGHVLWQQELTKACYASPVWADGRVYALDLDGVMHILELADTYQEVGTCALGEMAGATPAFVDGRIYIRGLRYLYCVGE
jgi:outer membrane protein assembly factor BamB/ferredoxin